MDLPVARATSTAGDGEGGIEVTIPVGVVVNDAFTPLNNQGLAFSPVHGLAVACDSPASCPLTLTIGVSQCGTVAVVGGIPTEVVYEFAGDPSACPVELTVTTGSGVVNAQSTSVPGVVLNATYKGSGDDGALAGAENAS